ncbi:MAG TPA: hypothetical protein VK611_09875 [Acidimicrobiales bacterium]|nr:hypothetical protein [Acidimicrobiales bacterium]
MPASQHTELYSPIPTEWLVEPELAAQVRGGVTFEEGKVVGILDNGKLKGFADALEIQLRRRGARDVVRWTKHYQEGEPDDALVDEVHRLVDSALVGLGN